MNTFRAVPFAILLVVLSADTAPAQQGTKLSENAALRYWSAFAQMQDVAISDDQAKELALILEGTAPYSDLKYRSLIEKNRPALETMIRGTALPNCDWGMDYQLGSETPIDFVRKALTLGRLNVLYAFHLAQSGDKDGAARVLAAGLRFSHDVSSGGTLFASVAATHLLTDHLRTIAGLSQLAGFSRAQRSLLRAAVNQLGSDGLDWRSNVKRELEIPRDQDPNFPHGLSTEAKTALARIVPAYVATLDRPSTIADVQQMVASAPQPLPEIIPNPEPVVKARQGLIDKLQQTRSLLH